MAKVEFTGRSASYIFENAGGMRDQLEQTILNELQEKRYPLKATISTLKSGKDSPVLFLVAKNNVL